MSDETRSQPEPEIEEVIASYLQARDEGRAPDPDELLARYPHLADELRPFLSAERRLADAAPRPRGAAAETATAAADRTAAREVPPAGETLGAYDLLELIGAGGMGVVYKARHRELGRVVALKLILAGRLARSTDRERFRVEARAAARLDEEGIVRLYEIGEHEGLPFIASEYCPGGSLEKRLNRTPVAPAEAARTVAALAAAVQKAHDARIVHRDLKPANVLVAADGRYKVGDFGLAKLLDEDGSASASNAILGSPSYMSPEQAEGRGALVGFASDVYGLGAILYEMLTGRPPFRGETVAETLRRVARDEPVPPRRLNRAVPRDLETVCLKCLEKDPTQRFASARDLVEELEQFLAGRPVRTRPVGVFGRTWRWCQRHPVPSAAALVVVTTATVAVALIARSRDEAVELARHNGELADAQARLAEANGRLAVEMGKLAEDKGRLAADAEREKGEAVAARNETQVALAQALLAPLNSGDGTAPLSPYEWNSLRQLASLRGTRASTAFLEEATGSPLASKQLEARSAFALHAAVGLDERLRAEADRLLLARLNDPAATRDQRTSVALAVARWEAALPATVDKAATVLVGAVRSSGTRDTRVPAARVLKRETRGTHAAGLVALAARTEPDRAAEVLRAAVAPGGSLEPVRYLMALADRVPPGVARPACEAVAEALAAGMALVPNEDRYEMPWANDWTGWANSAFDLAAVAGRLEPAKAAAVCDRAAALALGGAAKLPPKSDPRFAAAGVLALAERMEPEKAAAVRERVVTLLLDGLAMFKDVRTDTTAAAESTAPYLAAALARVEPARALKTLAEALRKVPHQNGKRAVAAALSAVAARAEPEAAGKVLTDALLAENEGGTQMTLAEGLGAVAVRVDPESAGRMLSEAFSRVNDPYALRNLATHLVAAAGRMEPARAGKLLNAALMRTDSNTLGLPRQAVWDALAVTRARQIDPRAGLKEYAESLTKAGFPSYDRQFTHVLGLVAVAARAEPGAAADLLLDTLARVIRAPGMSAAAVRELASAVATVAGRLEPRRKAEVCGRAASLLGEAAAGAPAASGELAVGLSVLLAHLTPDAAAEAADRAAVLALDDLDRVLDRAAPNLLTQKMKITAVAGFVTVARRIGAERGARLLVDALARNGGKNPPVQRELSAGLSGLLLGLPHEDTGRPADPLADAPDVPFLMPPPSPRARPQVGPDARPLPPQVLVDLLKHPFCVGDARRAVLDALEVTYGRAFADQWEFMAFAREKKLPLDLLAPPDRPRAKT